MLFASGVLAAVIYALVYAELGSAFPYAGGDYVGVGRVLGPWAGAATLAIWAATAGPNIAFEAQVVSVYVREIVPGLPDLPLVFAALAAALLIALLAVRTGAAVTGVFLAVEFGAVLALIFAGAGHSGGAAARLSHPLVLGPNGAFSPAPLGVLGLGLVTAVYATVGGNQGLYFGEELKDPHKGMGRVVLLACLMGALATSLPVIALVAGAPDLKAVLKSPAPFAAFMTESFGRTAGLALSAAVALAIFNAMIASIMFCARLFYSLGRDRLFPEPLSRAFTSVHGATGVPVFATLFIGAFTALCCLLPSHTLLMFLTGLMVYGWSLVCLAVLVGRRRGLTGAAGFWRAPLHPVAPIIGLLMALAFTIADLADPVDGRPGLLALGAVFFGAIAWERLVLSRRPGGWAPTVPQSDQPSSAGSPAD